MWHRLQSVLILGHHRLKSVPRNRFENLLLKTLIPSLIIMIPCYYLAQDPRALSTSYVGP
jgi:hypothetical protein